MKIVKRTFAIGATVAALGVLAAPASAEPPPPYGWVSCEVDLLEFNYTFGDRQAIRSAVQSCVDAGGHPTAVHFGITF